MNSFLRLIFMSIALLANNIFATVADKMGTYQGEVTAYEVNVTDSLAATPRSELIIHIQHQNNTDNCSQDSIIYYYYVSSTSGEATATAISNAGTASAGWQAILNIVSNAMIHKLPVVIHYAVDGSDNCYLPDHYNPPSPLLQSAIEVLTPEN